MQHNKDHTPLKAYSLTQLATLYGLSVPTMKKWLTPLSPRIGRRIGRYYNLIQVTRIFCYFGLPGRHHIDESSG